MLGRISAARTERQLSGKGNAHFGTQEKYTNRVVLLFRVLCLPIMRHGGPVRDTVG